MPEDKTFSFGFEYLMTSRAHTLYRQIRNVCFTKIKRTVRSVSSLKENMGICSIAVHVDAVNKISTCCVVVISNPTVCDVCVFHTAVLGQKKLFAVLGFLV